MEASTPITLAVAVYGDRDSCVADYHGVREAKTEGEYDHVAVAVITKRPDGSLEVERHDSTAKHLAWGGALRWPAPAASPVTSGGTFPSRRFVRWATCSRAGSRRS
jgi:hypothetical protein